MDIKAATSDKTKWGSYLILNKDLQIWISRLLFRIRQNEVPTLFWIKIFKYGYQGCYLEKKCFNIKIKKFKKLKLLFENVKIIWNVSAFLKFLFFKNSIKILIKTSSFFVTFYKNLHLSFRVLSLKPPVWIAASMLYTSTLVNPDMYSESDSCPSTEAPPILLLSRYFRLFF